MVIVIHETCDDAGMPFNPMLCTCRSMSEASDNHQPFVEKGDSLVIFSKYEGTRIVMGV